MRILHTSDWHIGRSFHGHSTLSALAEVLHALVLQVREHAVDAVLVSGDIFDSATPSAACYTLLTDTLTELADAGTQVIVTSGNHDSAARLGFQSGLLRAGVYVRTDPLQLDQPITLTDEFGEVDVYPIPYLEPALVRHLWEGVELRKQVDTLTHAMGLVHQHRESRVAGGTTVRSVVMAHCFAAGVEATPGVEREVRQGGVDMVPVSVFDGIDYTALGHIHGRQELRANVRYAGAPLHYSFGEQHKPRGSWLVTLDADGFADAQWLDLPVPRRLVTLRATLDELLDDERFAADEDAWVCAEYTDATPQRDPMRRLRARFEHCALVLHTPTGVRAAPVKTYGERLQKAATDIERIEVFLADVRNGEGVSEAEREILQSMIDERVRVEARA